jgi:ankyrin repeat protein
VVAVLLAAGLDVNVRTAGGTALHEAALCGKVEVVRTLLDGGVDLGIRDSQHNTVMDLLGQFPAHVTHDITAIIKSKSLIATEFQVGYICNLANILGLFI